MLRAACTITGSSGGPGTYTATVLFSDAAKAPFVRVGDVLEDRLGNEYTITTWSGFPSDFSSGGTMTVDFITSDTLPATFGGFGNAAVFTPAQVDVRPRTQSAGQIQTQVLSSGQDYLYDLDCTWFDATSAANVLIGDHIMDGAGKVFEITVTNGGATSVTVQEFIKEGVSPILGSGTLFSPTVNISLFQGTPVSDPARTVARNKDDFNIDAKFKELEDSISAAGAGAVVQETLENSSGSLINALDAVGSTGTGTIATMDVSDEDLVNAFRGVAVSSVADSASGAIASFGRIENITTSLNLQSAVFVDKTGQLTDIKPNIGVNGFVAGDWIIYVGHITRNQTTPANKDLFLKPEIVGQL